MDRAAELEKKFDLPLLAAALLTIPLIIVELVDVGAPWEEIAYAGDWIVWIIFFVHLVVMVRVSGWGYLHRNLLATAVVLLTFPAVPPGVQGFRFLRILRILRLVEFGPVVKRFFNLHGARYAGVLAGVALFGGAGAYSAAEKHSFGVGIYWAIQTLTTVGYGDVPPVTTLGRVIACVLMVVGVGLFAVVTGAIAQQFLSDEVEEAAEVREEAAVERERQHEISDELLLNEIAALTSQITRLESLVKSRAQPRDQRI